MQPSEKENRSTVSAVFLFILRQFSSLRRKTVFGRSNISSGLLGHRLLLHSLQSHPRLQHLRPARTNWSLAELVRENYGDEIDGTVGNVESAYIDSLGLGLEA